MGTATPKELASLVALQTLLDGRSSMKVIHPGGFVWDASFTFELPASEDAVADLENKLPTALPASYRAFLLHHDGAILYCDDAFGQWGYKLYGTNELLDRNAAWRQMYGEDWLSSMIVFAETIGDLDLLAFDTTYEHVIRPDYVVVDGDSAKRPTEWRVIVQSFATWLDRLIVAQGAKYWRWYPPSRNVRLRG